MLVKNNEISKLNFLTQSSGVSYELNLYSINSIIDFDIILCHTEYTTFCEKKKLMMKEYVVKHIIYNQLILIPNINNRKKEQ